MEKPANRFPKEVCAASPRTIAMTPEPFRITSHDDCMEGIIERATRHPNKISAILSSVTAKVSRTLFGICDEFRSTFPSITTRSTIMMHVIILYNILMLPRRALTDQTIVISKGRIMVAIRRTARIPIRIDLLLPFFVFVRCILISSF